MNEYVSSSKARDLLSVTSETLRNWASKDKISSIRTPAGHRQYSLKDINLILGRTSSLTEKQKICYARVSSRNQLNDLERQLDFFRREYPNHTILSDVGSGINWKRKNLKTILEQSMLGNVEELVVAHRDRLCRFAFELIQFILETNKIKLVILNSETGESNNNELADDILSIIHVYSCRAMGKRRYSSKKDKDISNTTTENCSETMDGDEQICI
jgi:putative resolvase